MGFNTVIVVYNDTLSIGADDPSIGKRIQDAVRNHAGGIYSRDIFARTAGGGGGSYGQVISQAHADYQQIVVVGRNIGRPIDECNDLDPYAIDLIADALRRHGWTVKPPKKAGK